MRDEGDEGLGKRGRYSLGQVAGAVRMARRAGDQHLMRQAVPGPSGSRLGPLTGPYRRRVGRPRAARGSRRPRPSQARAPSTAAGGQGADAADREGGPGCEGRARAPTGPGLPPPRGRSPRAARWPSVGSQAGRRGLGRPGSGHGGAGCAPLRSAGLRWAPLGLNRLPAGQSRLVRRTCRAGRMSGPLDARALGHFVQPLPIVQMRNEAGGTPG